MREDNLLAIRQRRFIVTTDSQHDLEVYLNLAKRMKLRAVNQLWIADLTYIRLRREFVYLAVILDGRSRRVVGWALDRTLAARLAVTALERAIAARQPDRVWCITPTAASSTRRMIMCVCFSNTI
jgi:transposase InsO family protein